MFYLANVKWLNGLGRKLCQLFVYFKFVYINFSFICLMFMLRAIFVFFLYYFLFASFHRQYVYHDLTVCVFVKHAKPLQIFCRNTILVSLNHTNNVFESIIKTWTHTEHGANNAVLHIIYKMNCTVHCAQCSIAFIFYLLFYSFCRIPPRLALQTELSHQVNMHAVHGNATQSNYVARFSSCDVRNDRAE